MRRCRRATGVRITHMDIFAHDEAATNAPGQGGIQQGNHKTAASGTHQHVRERPMSSTSPPSYWCWFSMSLFRATSHTGIFV